MELEIALKSYRTVKDCNIIQNRKSLYSIYEINCQQKVSFAALNKIRTPHIKQQKCKK
jgi:hypothetical protein